MLTTRLQINLPSPEQPFVPDWANPNHVEVFIKRDDLIHPIISGNKWRKLSDGLSRLVSQGAGQVISFGGGHSNHLHALGFCCMQLGITCHAIIRGDYRQHPTDTITDLQRFGTHIHYVDKLTYRKRAEPSFLAELQQRYPNGVIIPEGGSNQHALPGVGEIIRELQHQYDYLLLPVASGGTLAGLIHARPATRLIGVAVLKGQDYLHQLVNDLLPDERHDDNWQIDSRFHWGGYAKAPAELAEFCQHTRQHYGIPLEPVYSGKVFYALQHMLAQSEFKPNSKVLVLHTGGIRKSTVLSPLIT